MATLIIQASENGFPTLSRTLTLADSDMDLMIQAFQSDANLSIHQTATRAQVMLYITNVLANVIKSKIQIFKTQAAIVPDEITIT